MKLVATSAVRPIEAEPPRRLEQRRDADARYRALVDVAGALASHSELPDLLRSLRGHLEPLIAYSFLAVCLRDRTSETITVRFLESPDGAA